MRAVLEGLIGSLEKRIEFHRSNTNDPHNVGNAVVTALEEIKGAAADVLKDWPVEVSSGPENLARMRAALRANARVRSPEADRILDSIEQVVRRFLSERTHGKSYTVPPTVSLPTDPVSQPEPSGLPLCGLQSGQGVPPTELLSTILDHKESQASAQDSPELKQPATPEPPEAR